MKADFLRYHIEDLLSFLFENKINEKIKNISTHHLTVLIMCVILHAEQREREKSKDLKEFPRLENLLKFFPIDDKQENRNSDWRNDLCICRVFLERVYLMICSRLMTVSLHRQRRIRSMVRTLPES